MKYIVLIRAINVGGRNKLPMKDLTNYLEGLGCTNVKPYLQSGNVILDSLDDVYHLKSQIETVINLEKLFKPEVFIYNMKEFNTIVDKNPFFTNDGKLLHFYFFANECLISNKTYIDKYKSETENYKIVGKTLYLFAPDGIGRSKFVPKIEMIMGQSTTGRNLNTIMKLKSKLAE